MSLRPYQREALDALYAGWAAGGRRLGVSLPTGVGKTHVMAHLGAEDVAAGRDVLYLVHRDALVEQTTARLRATLPATASVGVVKAARNEVGARCVVASVHTLRREHRRAFLRQRDFRRVVVDEAHVSRSATYLDVFRDVRAFEPGGADLAGFTATWTRSDALGLGDVWEEVVYHKTIQWALRQRPALLVTPRAVRVGVGADLAGVRVSRSTGDYREEDLEAAVMLEEVRDAVVAGVLRHRAGRAGVLFAPTVASAEFFGDALREAGLRVSGWYHSTPAGERRRVDREIRAGELDLMTTCTAVAEGYDNPSLGFGVLCRPTRHEGLFVQMVGRLLRPWPGKTEALLLDAVGATLDVKLRAAVDLSVTAERATGEAEEDPAGDEEPDEPAYRDRLARVRAEDAEVALFAGTPVQWLTSPVGVPFVPCGDSLVFLLQDRDGWRVGQCASRLGSDGRPAEVRLVAAGLAQEDALQLASDHAECEGEHLSRRSARWRTARPSEAQQDAALRMGIVTEGLTRGQVSDRMSAVLAGRVLAPFAAWSAAQLSEVS